MADGKDGIISRMIKLQLKKQKVKFINSKILIITGSLKNICNLCDIFLFFFEKVLENNLLICYI